MLVDTMVQNQNESEQLLQVRTTKPACEDLNSMHPAVFLLPRTPTPTKKKKEKKIQVRIWSGLGLWYIVHA